MHVEGLVLVVHQTSLPWTCASPSYLAETSLTNPVQDGLGPVELGIDSARKGTLNRTVAPPESYISRCGRLVSTVDPIKQPPASEECVRNGW